MSDRYSNPDDNSVLQQLRSIMKRLDRLESGNSVGHTSIDAGSLDVTTGVLKVGSPTQSAVYFGPVTDGVNIAQGFIFRRANSHIVFDLQGSLASQFWALYDDSGNITVSDDTASEQGLARPYIPLGYGVHWGKTFAVTTTSATFEGMWIFRFKKQHPKVYIDPMFKCSDGTTGGEYQIVDNATGNPIGSPATIVPGLLGRLPWLDAVDGAHMADMELQLEVRRTAGAGNIGVEIYNAYGRQT